MPKGVFISFSAYWSDVPVSANAAMPCSALPPCQGSKSTSAQSPLTSPQLTSAAPAVVTATEAQPREVMSRERLLTRQQAE